MENQTRGILVLIDDQGHIRHQVMGQLNDAEILGLGHYLIDIPAAVRQIRTGELVSNSMQVLASTIERVLRGSEEEKEECLQESSLDSSRSSDS